MTNAETYQTIQSLITLDHLDRSARELDIAGKWHRILANWFKHGIVMVSWLFYLDEFEGAALLNPETFETFIRAAAADHYKNIVELHDKLKLIGAKKK